MLPILRADKTRPIAQPAAMLAWLTFALAATALGQTKPPAVDATWSGGAQCQIDVQGPGYAHHETHTWMLSGAQPTRQGAMRVYAGTWSVSGQGSLQRTQGTQTLKAQWTTNASLSQAPVAVFVRACRPQADHQVVARAIALAGRGNRLPAGIHQWSGPVARGRDLARSVRVGISCRGRRGLQRKYQRIKYEGDQRRRRSDAARRLPRHRGVHLAISKEVATQRPRRR